MSEEIKNLVRKRGVIKARLTLFKKYVDQIEVEISEKQCSKELVRELEIRLIKQQSLLEEFDECQSALEMKHENLEEQIIERELFENIYFPLMAKCKEMLANHTQSQADMQLDNLSSVSDESPLGQSEHSKHTKLSHHTSDLGFSGIKLPQLELPKFSGDYENWLEFRDTFSSIINDNTDIPNVSKFHYLRAQLEGSAKQIIHSLQVSSENYSIAWQLVCERYNNTKLLVYNHVKSLVDAPNLHSNSSAEFRKMVDLISKHIRALDMLKQPVQHWDTLLIFLLSRKLDTSTEREWENFRKTKDLPSLNEFKQFIKTKADLLETLEFNHGDNKLKVKEYKLNTRNKSSHTLLSTTDINCVFCKGSHTINNCGDFLKLSVDERVKEVNEKKLCLNCLRDNHFVYQCKSGHCRKCRLKHNTLLHFERYSKSDNEASQQKTNSVESNNDSTSVSQANVVVSNHNTTSTGEVLLSTAMVQILDSTGRSHTCRALLDTGSQSNLITSELANKLGVQQSEVKISIVGVGQAVSNVKSSCVVSLQSIHNNFEMSVSCLILPKISEAIPGQFVNTKLLKIPSHVRLADPDYNIPNKIDILLGSSAFYRCLAVGQLSLGNDQPIMQKTCFGWVIAGPTMHAPSKVIRCNFNQNIDIQNQIAKFWEIEEPSVPATAKLSADEQECENVFTKTTFRDQTGRFVVTIPLKHSPCVLGESNKIALDRFYSVENKLKKNSNLYEMYSEFMRDYESLGHMTKVTTPIDNPTNIQHFLPHHGILKEQSTTTKLRVVFDASVKTSSGYSFNDIQLVGPTIQDDLISIILRFRQHNIVVCADAENMYRQILVNPEQRHLQQIFWRSDPSKNIEVHTLNTVTYGTASAPFLAIRCLKQLAIDNAKAYPEATQIIARDFYVDDMLTGSHSVETATELCLQVSSILQSAGFNLRKWISNSSELLKNIQSPISSSNIMHFGETSSTKTLGLLWSSVSDNLMYSIAEGSDSNQTVTKRSVLSEIAKIYDPLGLLNPCLIVAKILLQKLWLFKLSWDESLPSELHTSWQLFRNQLSYLNEIKIPRQVVCCEPEKIEIHGFADASTEAYGSCVFIRSISFDGNIHVALVISKTKVAPLKPLTIPRLELCGAVIAIRLVKRVIMSMKLSFDEIFLWSDSTIALSWIRTPPNLLQTFVANRVVEIQSFTEPHTWNHVSTDDNPADLLTRGVSPSKLQTCDLWFHGPSWLRKPQEYWPKTVQKLKDELPELKKQSSSFMNLESNIFPIKNFSNFTRPIRVKAYCLRFVHNCRIKQINRISGHLTKCELDSALQRLIKYSQHESFPDVISYLQANKTYHSKGNLSSLNPFLDSDGVLRITGRLLLSNFDYEKKHPILLLSNHHPFTKLLFEYEHKRLFHAGPQLLLSSIRENYWPLRGRNLAKNIVHNCIRCFRTNPKQNHPIMGHLPESRVKPSPVFHKTGVDYAGPFMLKEKGGRGSKTIKGYISLFVCFATKSIHLELVTELTTEAFIAAFRRFVARRGKPETVFSDNGRNFLGAQIELKELGDFLTQNDQAISEIIANEGVNWKFIPAHSPHFGGLWEAGVKSCKYHLKRVMSKASLTFEIFYTTLTQIEAILNSRPLTPISTDPNDLDVLTPAHFLIGRRLTSLPDSNFENVNENRLSKFQRAQQLQQHFWRRWSKEYISELQQRVKWKTTQLTLQEGDMVLIKNDNVPPLQWPIGRVVQLHPGADGVSRVASIKTASGSVVKRSFAKICVLPIEGSSSAK